MDPAPSENVKRNRTLAGDLHERLTKLEEYFVRGGEIREIIQIRLIEMRRRGLKSLRELDAKERLDAKKRGSKEILDTITLLGPIPTELEPTLIQNLDSDYDPSVLFWKGYDLRSKSWQRFILNSLWLPCTENHSP
jgi:hypothetical protein